MRTSFLYTIGAVVILGILVALAAWALKSGIHGVHYVPRGRDTQTRRPPG
jgi:hypothetical protein